MLQERGMAGMPAGSCHGSREETGAGHSPL